MGGPTKPPTRQRFFFLTGILWDSPIIGEGLREYAIKSHLILGLIVVEGNVYPCKLDVCLLGCLLGFIFNSIDVALIHSTFLLFVIR